MSDLRGGLCGAPALLALGGTDDWGEPWYRLAGVNDAVCAYPTECALTVGHDGNHSDQQFAAWPQVNSR